MSCMTHPVITASFYKFVGLDRLASRKVELLACCQAHAIKGTILLAPEGINASLAGAEFQLRAVVDTLRRDPALRDLQVNWSPAQIQPFHRLKIRIKREIVTLDVSGINPAAATGEYVAARDWNHLIRDPKVILVDVRNDYETAIGSFAGTLDPKLKRFKQLPAWLREQPKLKPETEIAMYCTGGIRCEKSTALLRSWGFDRVYQLQGGILQYLLQTPKAQSLWRGECFVFDERVAVGHGLVAGSYQLCRGCRRPIGPEQWTSVRYRAGVSCPSCYDVTNDVQKARFAERARQVALAKQRKLAHVGVPHN